MDIKQFKSFLRKNNYKEDNRSGNFEKRINDVTNRYIIKDVAIFFEIKRNETEGFQLAGHGDIRKMYIDETSGTLTGLIKSPRRKD
jgi:hypothetical protein